MATFYNYVSLPGQWEYPFEIELPPWLPSSFILQSDYTRNGRRQAKIYYRLRATLEPFGAASNFREGKDNDSHSSKGIGIPRFFTKRDIFVYRRSGVTDKHFTEERLPDWENVTYNDPRLNPQFSLRSAMTLLRVSLDRTFYYVGDAVTVQLMVDNSQAKLHVSGVELALMRQIEAEGSSSELFDRK